MATFDQTRRGRSYRKETQSRTANAARASLIHGETAIEFLSEVREHFPFAIQKIQTDNDSSFGPQFTWHLSDLSISHRHIPPGCPEVNGKVERSHKTDAEEFYRAKRFHNKRDLARKLKRWETEYNERRPHLALEGKLLLSEFANSLSPPNL